MIETMQAGATPTVIDDFTGDFFWLSNFFPSPVELDGALYITVENAFQAAKTLDHAARVAFETCGPDEAKMRGMTVALRPDWETAKVPLMEAYCARSSPFRPLPDG